MAERVEILLSEAEVDAKIKNWGSRSVRIMQENQFIWCVY